MKIDVTDLITQQEAADLRGVTLQAMNKLVRLGRLKTITIGKRAFLLRSEVEAYEPSVGGRPKKTVGARKRKSAAKKRKS